MSQAVADHAVNTGKVVMGGVGVAGTTYATTDWIIHATEWATFTAAAATTVYFLVSAGYALWKWKNEAHGK